MRQSYFGPTFCSHTGARTKVPATHRICKGAVSAKGEIRLNLWGVNHARPRSRIGDFLGTFIGPSVTLQQP